MIIYYSALLFTISYIDLKHLIIPDLLVIFCALPVFISGFHIAFIIPLAVYFATAAVCALLKRDMPFGMGDAKLLAALALCYGIEGLCFSYFAAAICAALYSFALLILKRANKKDRIAFGPFIAFGFMLYLASTSAM